MEEQTSTNSSPAAEGNESSQAQGGSILTNGANAAETPPADGKADDGKEAEGKETPPQLPASPADYKIEFAPETTVNEALLGDFQQWAHENKVPLEAATALAKKYEAMVNDQAKNLPQMQAQAMEEQKQTWLKELKADKDLGGANWDSTMKDINTAMKAFATDELRQWLDSSGAGNNPHLVKFIARMGKEMAEPSFVRGGETTGREKSAAEVLYPNK